MVSIPLFLKDAEEVKKLLRLSEIPAGGNSDAAVDRAIDDTKTVLWEELGIVRIAEVTAFTFTAAQPTTDNEFLHIMARRCELNIVRYNLTFSLSMGYRSGAVSFIESYSSEGQFRSFTPEELQKFRFSLWGDARTGIGRQLAFLRGTVSGGEAKGAKMQLFGGEGDRKLLYYDPADPNDILEQFIIKP